MCTECNLSDIFSANWYRYRYNVILIERGNIQHGEVKLLQDVRWYETKYRMSIYTEDILLGHKELGLKQETGE